MKMSVGFRQFSSCCALTLLVLGVAASSVRADENDDNSYKFKAPSPGEEPDYEFHPVKAANPHSIFLDYDFPRFSGYVTYSPSYFNLSQNLQFGSSLPQFSTSAFSPVGFSLKADLEFSALFGMSLTGSFASYSASSATLGTFLLQQSTASVFSVGVEPYYCFHPGGSLLKVCPGIGIGVDSFPVINFVNGVAGNLALTSYSNLVVGPHIKLIYPFSGNLTGYVQGGFDFAPLRSGNSTGIHTNSDTIASGEFGFETPLSVKTQFLASFLIQDKSSNFQQITTGNAAFTWSAAAMVYALNLGVHYGF